MLLLLLYFERLKLWNKHNHLIWFDMPCYKAHTFTYTHSVTFYPFMFMNILNSHSLLTTHASNSHSLSSSINKAYNGKCTPFMISFSHDDTLSHASKKYLENPHVHFSSSDATATNTASTLMCMYLLYLLASFSLHCEISFYYNISQAV